MLLLRVGAGLAGLALLGVAVGAIWNGRLRGPQALVYGTPVGEAVVLRSERPVGFWIAVAGLILLGGSVLAAALWV